MQPVTSTYLRYVHTIGETRLFIRISYSVGTCFRVSRTIYYGISSYLLCLSVSQLEHVSPATACTLFPPSRFALQGCHCGFLLRIPLGNENETSYGLHFVVKQG